MLVEFSVSNFRSIRDKQTLSMVKGKGSELETTHTFKPAAPSSETLLKSAAIYGANAAGKSNIIKALSMMKQIVVQPPNVGEQLPVVPFMFDPETPQQPTEFELVFITDNVRYQYGFSATAERIWSEWLFAFPKGRSQRWFEREYSPQTGEYTWP
jgi:Predicted ATPases